MGSLLGRIACLAAGLLWVAGMQAQGAPKAQPTQTEVLEALKRALALCQELAVQGGYASAWSNDLKVGKTEHSDSATVVSIQPPGTTTLGPALLAAYQATGDRAFWEAAAAAARCLARCQLHSGGWPSDFDFEAKKAAKFWLHQSAMKGDASGGKRQNWSTLDDDKTQSALRFLLEISLMKEAADDAEIQEAWRFGLQSLLAAQMPSGAWPQQYDGPAAAVDAKVAGLRARYPAQWSRVWPHEDYKRYATLNDGNLQKVGELLLAVHARHGDAKALASAKRLGDFLCRAQMPEPQPVWAQQYNADMEPVWARKFEPPAVTAGESLGVMRFLLDLNAVTGDAALIAGIPAALKWYERSRLPDGSYARFYELQTNRALFMTKAYELTDKDDDLPTHYGFKLTGLEANLQKLQQALSLPAAQRLPAYLKTDLPKAGEVKSVVGKVRDALRSQQADGRWQKGRELDAKELSKNITLLAHYLMALGKTQQP